VTWMRDEGTLMSGNVAGRVRRSSRDSAVPPGLMRSLKRCAVIVSPSGAGMARDSMGAGCRVRCCKASDVWVVAQFDLFRCVILSEAVFQAERRILAWSIGAAREIPRPAGENAGLREDACEWRGTQIEPVLMSNPA